MKAFTVFCLITLCQLFDSTCARALHQAEQQPAGQLAAAVHATPLVQLGDGSARVLDRKYMQQRGGAVIVLGQPALKRLKQAARFHGSVQELAKHIDEEHDLGVDAVNVALMYQCAGMTANASAAEIASSVGPSAADPVVTSAAQAFALSSRPGASKKIFLDFDGHTTTGTNWNSLAGRDPIVTPAYDKDGIPTSFSSEELSDIVAIWRAVSEDFSMFDVDVTTADPGQAALTGNGIRVAIGGSYSDWFNNPAGGVAYVGSFGMGNTPCFVFPQNLGPNYAKYVWEAVSHEVGHTLGLFHDGTTNGAAYYSGQGDWAPIMGSGYYKPVTQFDKGEYAGSNNQQDDVAVMSTYLPLLPQENGNSMATATPLNATLDAATGIATAKVSGVVSSAAGDWFMFQAAAGTATLSAAVTAAWGSSSGNRANLDIQLVVYDAAGTALATINPAGSDPSNGLGVPPTAVTLPVNNTYYIAVTGAGAADPASTGYSSYGSRGQFELTASFMPCVACNETVALPAPASPSPSPAPPSPSPSPAPQTMRVTALSMTKSYTTTTKTSYYCSVTVTVRDVSLIALPGVRVNGAWSAVPAITTFAASTANVLTSAAGTVAFRSGAISAATGNSCVFSVGDVVLSGYVLDPAASLMSKKLSW